MKDHIDDILENNIICLIHVMAVKIGAREI
jgi:hypothetical protein